MKIKISQFRRIRQQMRDKSKPLYNVIWFDINVLPHMSLSIQTIP